MFFFVRSILLPLTKNMFSASVGLYQVGQFGYDCGVINTIM